MELTKEPEPEEIWIDHYGEIRIMAVVEGYVVARRKGAYPFVRPIRIFVNEFRRNDD